MSQKANILFVDDEESILSSLNRLFKMRYSVFTATSGVDALKVVQDNNIQVVVCDQRMPGMVGVEVLGRIREISPHTMRILLTGYSDMDAAIKSVNEGEIFRYISKPWDNMMLRTTVELAASVSRKESAQQGAPKPVVPAVARSEQVPVDLLVIDNDRKTFEKIKELFRNTTKVHYATDLDSSLGVLESNPTVGIIISELKVGKEDVTDFVSTLKAHYPLILTIVLTDFADSSSIVRLINKGQIFRFHPKPVGRVLVKISIERAMERYRAFLNTPALLERHKVEELHSKTAVSAPPIEAPKGPVIRRQGFAQKILSIFRRRRPAHTRA